METWICSRFMWDTTSIKIKYKLSKNYVVLVYDEKVSTHVWRIAIVTVVLPGRDWAIVRIKNANTILKHPLNKLFPTGYTYHDANQTDKTREQKLRLEAAVIDELKRKYEC